MTSPPCAPLACLNKRGDVRQHGMAKEGLIARQFILGVVQTAEVFPIYHEVYAK